MNSATLLNLIYLNLINWELDDKIMLDPGTNISFSFTNESIKGELVFSSTSAAGFETLDITGDIESFIIVQEEDDNGNNDVCIQNFAIENLVLYSEYFLDMALINTIPLYGKGEFKIMLRNINADICFYAVTNYSEPIKSIENFNIKMTFDQEKVEITGFMKNSFLEPVASDLAQILITQIAMWHNYDSSRASCLFSPVLQYLTNVLLEYEDNSFVFDVDECLVKGTPFGDLTTYDWDTTLEVLLHLLDHYRFHGFTLF